MSHEISVNKHICWAVAAMLFLAILPLPYGYYTLVRLVCVVFFGYFAYFYFNTKKPVIACLCVLIVMLFQPLIKVFFSKGVWMFIDLVVAGFSIYLGAQTDRFRRDN